MELASTLAHGYHSVGDKAVIEYRIALVKNVYVISNLYLKRALNYNVKLLTVMRVELHRSVLLLGNVGEFYQKRLRKLVLELGGKVVILNAVLF